VRRVRRMEQRSERTRSRSGPTRSRSWARPRTTRPGPGPLCQLERVLDILQRIITARDLQIGLRCGRQAAIGAGAGKLRPSRYGRAHRHDTDEAHFVVLSVNHPNTFEIATIPNKHNNLD